MERWLISLCLIAVSSILLVLCFVKTSARGKKQLLLPPGPWTLPVIGSLHHVLSVLPHRKLMELSRRHGPLMLLRLGEIPTVVVSDAETAALVMKTKDLSFASRPRSTTQKIFGYDGKDIALAPYSDHWRQMRKICIVELLSSKQVRRMEGIRAEEVGNLLRKIASTCGATINVSEKTAELGNDVVCRAVFGGKFTRQEEYLRELEKALVLLGGFCLVDLFPSSRLVRWLSNAERDMKRSCRRIHRIIANVIDERMVVRASQDDGSRNTDEEDLLGVLLRLQLEESLEFPLTTEVISAVLFDMFAGGTDTTSTVLEWTLSELVRNPEAMAKAQQEVREVTGHQDQVVITDSHLVELHYMRMVIKEVLRLHAPVPLLPRVAREDSTVKGHDIPKGTNLCINVFAISRDHRYWDDPEEFKPERFDNKIFNYNGSQDEYIPFGAGRRQCPGIQFGSSLIEMALANLLYHFDWMLPDGDSPASLDMSEKFGMTVNRRYDLQLRAIPYSGSRAATPLE